MAIKLLLKIFFAVPVWFLQCVFFKKRIFINNQILDLQTQALLSLQSLQVNPLANPQAFSSANDLRKALEG